MRLSKTSSVEELQVISRFESLRNILLSEQYADHLEKPLAYWALPTDRRLPLAFLGRSLEDLLHTPFVELSRTPGIGQKKICSFVKLLARAANTDPAELPVEVVHGAFDGEDPCHHRNGNGEDNLFDPANVSEVLWGKWRASVVKHGLEKETLGRFAPTLKNMTRVIWKRTLGEYAQMDLREIREMKTHGEKRVRAILDVFYAVHTLVDGMGTHPHLVVSIAPRLIDRVERWLAGMLQTPGVPSGEELFADFVRPLLDQIRNDAPRQIVSLAENRLGIDQPITSVRQAARTMGLTRARVYQLLNEINDIITVRWPHGRHRVYELRRKLEAEAAEGSPVPDLSQFLAAVELFYPSNRRGADGPLEHASEPDDPADESDAPGDARTVA